MYVLPIIYVIGAAATLYSAADNADREVVFAAALLWPAAPFWLAGKGLLKMWRARNGEQGRVSEIREDGNMAKVRFASGYEAWFSTNSLAPNRSVS